MGRSSFLVKWHHIHNPLKLLIFILALFSAQNDAVFGSDSDKSALLEFKDSISDPYGLLASWNSNISSHCSWVGVFCDSGSRVVALNLTSGGNSSSCARIARFPLYGFGIRNTRRSCLGGTGSNGKVEILGMLSSAIARLSELKILSLPFNGLSGEIPVEIWGMEKLEVLDLEGNSISGSLPLEFTGLRSLKVLNLGFNEITGRIPGSLSNCVGLQILNLAGNQINGTIPEIVGGFRDLNGLYLSFNLLRGSIPDEIGTNCGKLEHLELAGNFLSKGIPREIGNCRGLKTLLLYSNMLEDSIPSELGQLTQLEVLDVSRNNINGHIPSEIGNCTKLSVLILSNQWDPLSSSRELANEFNFYKGTVPNEITSLLSLRVLWAPQANLEGNFPSSWGSCKNLEMLNLAQNYYTGEIFEVFSSCKKLHFLNLSSNRLSGEIDGEIPVPCMNLFDISGNFLTGPVPKFKYGSCNQTKYGDSFGPYDDDLSSEYISYFGWRSQIDSSSFPSHKNSIKCSNFPGNPFHCPFFSLPSSPYLEKQVSLGTSQINPSSSSSDSSLPQQSSSSNHNSSLNSIEIASITSAAAIVSVLLALTFLFVYTRRRKPGGPRPAPSKEVILFAQVTSPLTFETVTQATCNFNASNCIGSGGFGATYKAEIAPGFLVAVKRLSVGRFQGIQQFDAEIKTLGRIRHPHLVTLIGYHASETEMFLIYNYLSGGNLEKFIQERSTRAVDWRVLHKIALDISRALAYLHEQCVPRVLHRDVKPSNILLDQEYNAYLSDFGLARLLGTSETHATTGVAGTFGYVAPEYAMTCRVSDKADVYSYGIVLLELLSDKKALDPSFSVFGNGFNIVAWGCMLLRQGRAKEFFAEGIWEAGPHDDLVEVLHLAVVCTVDSLSMRPTMKQVVRRLKQLQPPVVC